MINSQESSLIGQWLTQGSAVVADNTCHRIDSLTTNYLIKVADSADGWSTLFKDPADNRLWERTYPQSNLQSGGPPALQCVNLLDVRKKYDCEA